MKSSCRLDCPTLFDALLLWFRLVILKINKFKYSHLENLDKIVQCDSKTDYCFVKKSVFIKSKDGIILKIK